MDTAINIDLKNYVVDILYGMNGFPKLGVPLIHRAIRRNSDGNPTKCVCYDSVAGDIGQSNCTYCLGTGYLFDDNMIIGALVPPGLLKTTSTEIEALSPGKMEPGKIYMFGLFKYEPTDRDYIIEPYIDPTKTGAQDLIIKNKYDVESATAVIGSNNELAYYFLEIKSNTKGK